MKSHSPKSIGPIIMGIALITFGMQNSSAASIIDGSGITATASSFWSSGTAQKTVDGSGLSGGQHSNSLTDAWQSGGSDLGTQWIQWDLGTAYTLDSVHIWNNNGNSNPGAGIAEVDIYVSDNAAPGDPEGAGAANWTLIADNAVLPHAPFTGTWTTSSTYTGFDLETEVGNILPAGSVRFVRFEIESRWEAYSSNAVPAQFDSNWVGLSEIQFTGTAIPEPSVILMSSLGMLLLLRRKRAN